MELNTCEVLNTAILVCLTVVIAILDTIRKKL